MKYQTDSPWNEEAENPFVLDSETIMPIASKPFHVKDPHIDTV